MLVADDISDIKIFGFDLLVFALDCTPLSAFEGFLIYTK